jgi:hypothetical protein
MAENRLVVTELDFDTIKTNLKTYLKQQSEFQDYDFEGSGLSTLLDILAYNTHYNAYYLNMVANESFLDTALLRDSVVSHAKTLGYTPYSVTAPTAVINLTVESGSTTPESLTLPKGYVFLSNLLDNRSYNFVVMEDTTVTKSNTSFYFENIDIKEGQLVTYNYTHNQNSNPKAVFELSDSNIDTKTISVSVRPSSGNTQTTIYNEVTDILDVGPTSEVFFLQESRGGKYQIYFGDNVIGKKLTDGSIVSVTYLVTSGAAANKSNDFSASAGLSGYTNFTIDVANIAGGGTDRESVENIKYSARAQYSTQNRLVTLKDYEAYIQQNYPSIDSISVWGGEDETPKVFGKVFIALKPKLNYYISETEKQRIIDEIINPKAIVSVAAEIRDPEFLYLLIINNVQYDPKKTVDNETTIKNNIRNAVLNYRDQFLNKFGSTFVLSKLQDGVDDTNLNSIIGSECTIRVQRRFEPNLNLSSSYNIIFNVPLQRGTITNKLTSTEFDVFDTSGIRRTAIFDEVAQSFTGISEIQIDDPGSGYVTTPTITITGDGTGATAEAVIVNQKIQSIIVTNRGTDYTRALVTITGGSGYGASATAVIDGRIGTLRTIYFDSSAQRQVINNSAGVIDYDNGIITINDINILSVNSDDGLIRLSVESDKGIIKTTRSTIITIDEDDPTSIITTLEQSTKV